MGNLLTLLGLVGPLSMIVALRVIQQLSQRLGAVTKRARSYRWFYIAIGFIALSIGVRLVTLGAPEANDPNTELWYNLPLAAALTLSVLVAWQYWGWLLSERSAEPDGKAKRGNTP